MSLAREYWFDLVYQLIQPPLSWSNRLSSVDSLKALLPTTCTSRMRADSPSVTVKVRLTRLRSMGVTVVTTSRVVEAAAHVLALELLLGAVGQRLVVGAAIGQAHFAQRLLQRGLVEFLGADEVDVGNGRSLFDDHHQHVAVDVDAHVLEQPQVEQRTDGGGAALVVVGVAHAQRQRREDRTGFDALQAFDADVAHREGLDGPGCRGCERAGDERGNATQAKATEVCCSSEELGRRGKGRAES